MHSSALGPRSRLASTNKRQLKSHFYNERTDRSLREMEALITRGRQAPRKCFLGRKHPVGMCRRHLHTLRTCHSITSLTFQGQTKSHWCMASCPQKWKLLRSPQRDSLGGHTPNARPPCANARIVKSALCKILSQAPA